ncbi:MAG: YtxH domain-containing protein [Elusimicrobia bacterium]|nr:YtxH domain-containing protein [Elusimicrobiota bacterium]
MADNSGDSLVAFLLGGVAGAVAGLLLAPRSGAETREQLADWLEANREKTKEFLEHGRETLHEKSGKVAAAWEAGKKAYRENAG